MRASVFELHKPFELSKIKAMPFIRNCLKKHIPLRNVVLHFKNLCSISFKLAPRKKKLELRTLISVNRNQRISVTYINLIRKMPHNPHFRRDVEISKQANQSTSTNKDLVEISTESEPKSRSKIVQKARFALPFVFGGVASCVAEAATFPIDTAKTRLQLQGQARDKRHSSTPYRGMIHCWQKVATEEGFKILYSGIAPALLRQAVYGTIKYGLYYSIKDIVISSQICGEESAITNVSIAVVSGALASAVANPTDVLKVRMQSGKIISFIDSSKEKTVEYNQTKFARESRNASCKSDNQVYRVKMLSAFKDIYIQEGIGGLWRGVSPTAQRAALVAGVQLPVYDLTKVFFIRHDILAESPLNNLASSIVAGLCACMASSPMDVIRTRMMDQRKLKSVDSSSQGRTIPASQTVGPFSNNTANGPKALRQSNISTENMSDLNRKRLKQNIKPEYPAIYRSSFQCGYVTIKNEGLSALYRGFIPAFTRMGPWNIIFFLVYEQLKLLA